MRLINPVGWQVEHIRTEPIPADAAVGEPVLTLVNPTGNRFFIHPVSDRLVRVVHKLSPTAIEAKLDDRHRHSQGKGGVAWETVEGHCTSEWKVEHDKSTKIAKLLSPEGIQITVDFERVLRLSWFWPDEKISKAASPFLSDFKNGYCYDRRSGRVFHYTDREPYMPLSEHHRSVNENHLPPHDATKEFIYGLGETKGSLLKTGKRYVIDARDSLGYDVEDTDPLYKLCPFYLTHNSDSKMWLGMYYNSLVPSVADFGAEHDFSTGNFRSFSIEQGALDYYVLMGSSSIAQDGTRGQVARPQLRDIVSQVATLVTPYSAAVTSVANPKAPRTTMGGWQASPSLPRLSSFGYLASSLTLSEREDAQQAVTEYVIETRENGFPVDGMHLSSGYCLDPKSGERMYFVWNKQKYPDPLGLGRNLEQDLHCHLIINVKPWLLEGHVWYKDAAQAGAFVHASQDALVSQDTDRSAFNKYSRTFHWSTSMGQTNAGSHFDFSAKAGSQFWQKMIKDGISANGITGIWIDNNEFATLVDDGERLQGEIALWSSPRVVTDTQKEPTDSLEKVWARQVADRNGWSGGEIEVGAVGRATLTMGMAKSSWEQMALADPKTRPVVVTRSAVPGIQAYAHGTWSGDNSTTWKCLKWNTKMTLSVGISFGPGLYGHDIGGFCGAHSPSAELLVRWVQQSVWHSRFTLHSWKAVSTTFYMFKDQKEVSGTLLAFLQLRYQLVPMLYSLYVSDYHRKGWPVLRPLLWNHSNVRACLTQDEQFLLGDTLLAAPVLDAGAREVTFVVPHLLDDARDSTRTPTICWWYDWNGKRWIKPLDGQGSQTITLPAPLSVCPTLVRENGIMPLAGPTKSHVFDTSARTQRVIRLFPAPPDKTESRPVTFHLIEDDGISNDAAAGKFTELALTCSVQAGAVQLSIESVQAAYAGSWQWVVELPEGDDRKLQIDAPKGLVTVQPQKANRIALSVHVS